MRERKERAERKRSGERRRSSRRFSRRGEQRRFSRRGERTRDRLVQSFWISSTRRFSRRGRGGGKERSGERRRSTGRFSRRGERRKEPGRRNSPKSPTQEKHPSPTSVHGGRIQPVNSFIPSTTSQQSWRKTRPDMCRKSN